MGLFRIICRKFKTVKRNLELRMIYKRQNRHFKKEIKGTKNLIVFIVPELPYITGGILSIYNLCRTSRKFDDIHGAKAILATYPVKETHTHNATFKNNEFVYRFKQVISAAGELDSLIIHIPEFLSDSFFLCLSLKDIIELRGIKNLHINILNQNLMLMPSKERFSDLYKLTGNVTQTIAHHAYANQKIADQYNLPTELWPACVDISGYLPSGFSEKENIITYSKDTNENKQEVLKILKEGLPDFKFVEVRDMTFDTYMKTITKSKFVVSFGEGMDAYLLQPFYVGSIGIAAFNNVFFKDESILKYWNVYKDYQALKDNIVKDILYYNDHPDMYNRHIKEFSSYAASLYDENDYENRLKAFYLNQYEYLPSKKVDIKNVSVGCDVEEVERFKGKETDESFLDHVYTEAERSYCLGKGAAVPHLAVRFCAKEAIIKALYSLDITDILFKDIEILNNSEGVPFARLGKEGHENLEIRVSLSHSRDTAMASVMIFEKIS